MAASRKTRSVSPDQLEFDYSPGIAASDQPLAGGQAATVVASRPFDSDPASYIDLQYSGAKADLRPLYEKLVNLAMRLGEDIRVCPGKTIVPIYRKKVIAQVKPATSTRIDLGLALGKQKATGRLVDTGGYAKGDRITHRIPISTSADIDSEVRKWLETAYGLDK